MDIKILQTLEYINTRLSHIEARVTKLDEKLDLSLALQRNHLIRVKNGKFIDDNMILMGTPYNDINPRQAHLIWNNPDSDFFLLDVTSLSFNKSDRIEDAIHIPLEELPQRYNEIQSRTTPILVISEKGLRSIQAAEILIKRGFYNINNLSGGYEFWIGDGYKGNYKDDSLDDSLENKNRLKEQVG